MRFSNVVGLALVSAASAEVDLPIPTSIGGVPTTINVPSSVLSNLPTTIQTTIGGVPTMLSIPTSVRTSLPTSLPTTLSVPTGLPTGPGVPTNLPTTRLPTTLPSGLPTTISTSLVTSRLPTTLPSGLPTSLLTSIPTSLVTSRLPTTLPSGIPTSLPISIPTTRLPTSIPTGIPTSLPTSIPTSIPGSATSSAAAAASSLAARINSEITSAAGAANSTLTTANALKAANANPAVVVPQLINGFNTILPLLSSATNELAAALKARSPAASKIASTSSYNPAACLTATDATACMATAIASLGLPGPHARDVEFVGGGAALTPRQGLPDIFIPQQQYTLSTSFGGYLVSASNLFATLQAARPNAGPYVGALRNAVSVLKASGDALAIALENSASQEVAAIQRASASADAAANAAIAVYSS